ncbi:hypothetical protein C7405_1329 [Paraburkholderia caballeronis]|uniref:NrsF family protein n=1 Tax=Paraburkholderia caballeronis TaxID=416943 RepID=UPI001066E840|nr:DUF1109 domain-containing protein [Paraburkholderia caballeronis]TDV23314.1 hypothetical protein C7405_1329 [Paraburkholderia caballeronis]
MKTDDLIDMLSTGAGPADRHAGARRFGVALPLALLGSLLLMAALFGVRPDLAVVARTAPFWEKLAFAFFVGLGALVAVSRLARPGARIGGGWWLLALPVALVWIGGGLLVATAAPADRTALLLGYTWRTCPFNILLLSVPGFLAVFRAVRGLAPTRLRAAGAASGLLAGALATFAYSFHCPEMSPAFWGIWYLLGMLLATALGAALGPKLLRW